MTKLNGEKTGFISSNDSFISGKIDFDKVPFDLIYRSEFPKIKEILYDVNEKKLSAIVEYNLKLEKNNGKIKNLKQLINSFCIKEPVGSEYFKSLYVTQKGYTLTPIILDTIEKSIAIKLDKDEFLYKLGTKKFSPKYLVLKYESKEIID